MHKLISFINNCFGLKNNFSKINKKVIDCNVHITLEMNSRLFADVQKQLPNINNESQIEDKFVDVPRLDHVAAHDRL